MKTIALSLVLMFMICFASMAFSQTPAAPASSPVASVSPAPVASPAPAAAASGIFGFLKANLAAIALAVYAILDVVILASPALAGNGLLHQALLLAAKLSGQSPPA